jgi:hypothetical protein
VYIYARLEWLLEIMQFWNNSFKSNLVGYGRVLRKTMIRPRALSSRGARFCCQNRRMPGKAGDASCDAYVYRINHRNNEIADRFEQSLKAIGGGISRALPVRS